jgi:uncharacterized protein DUF3786
MQPESNAVDFKKTGFSVPEAHWRDLKKKAVSEICTHTGAWPAPPDGLTIPFLNETLRIDLKRCGICRKVNDRWDPIAEPLLELITIVYLVNAAVDPLKEEMIGISELKDAHFFQGPHAVDVSELLVRYGNDLEAFQSASLKIDGDPLDLADAAYRFYPFPKAPVYYLLWEGDEEFDPNISILFDRTIERHFPADGIWGLINLVSNALLDKGIQLV